MYCQINQCFRPTSSKGLHRLNILDPNATDPAFGNLSEPKTWTGPWIAITNPEEIVTHIKEANIRQHNQAQTTPFGSGPLADFVGQLADTEGLQAILNVEAIPAHIMETLLPEALRILHTLGIKPPMKPHTIKAYITEHQFNTTYTGVNEATFSSPSVRHVGHNKAILDSPAIVILHTAMLIIPFQTGVSPHRWQVVVDIMLEKVFGLPRPHRLQIISLMETDWNQGKNNVIARQLGFLLEDNKLISTMQYGSRPGRMCISAILNKQLAHGIVRLTRSSAAFHQKRRHRLL